MPLDNRNFNCICILCSLGIKLGMNEKINRGCMKKVRLTTRADVNGPGPILPLKGCRLIFYDQHWNYVGGVTVFVIPKASELDPADQILQRPGLQIISNGACTGSDTRRDISELISIPQR